MFVATKKNKGKKIRFNKNVIIDKTFSSIGQKKLHIHKRGNKGSKTQALGFKNTFISVVNVHDMKNLRRTFLSLYVRISIGTF